MSALSVRGVTAAYGRTEVLHGVDLEVPAGSLTAILGSSGSGKTTLLRVIAGFERPTGGTVTVGNTLLEGNGKHVAPERRHLGYVAQDGALFPHLTVARNVAFGLARKASRTNRVQELLDLVGLGELGKRYPYELSGGQQQRVALARALAGEPPVVLLDEPFAALDASLRSEVRRDISDILRKAGTTTVLVTHDQDEALSMADQVAVLRAGRVVQCGSPTDLYRKPHDVALAEFLGAANTLPAVAVDGGFHCALGDLRGSGHPAGTSVDVLIRPEQLQVSEQGTQVTVTASEYHGHEAVLSVMTDEGQPLLMRTQQDLAVGVRVCVAVHGQVHAWPRSSLR